MATDYHPIAEQYRGRQTAWDFKISVKVRNKTLDLRSKVKDI